MLMLACMVPRVFAATSENKQDFLMKKSKRLALQDKKPMPESSPRPQAGSTVNLYTPPPLFFARAKGRFSQLYMSLPPQMKKEQKPQAGYIIPKWVLKVFIWSFFIIVFSIVNLFPMFLHDDDY